MILTKKYILPLLGLLLLVVAACNEDEFEMPTSEPLVKLTASSVSGLPSGTVTIEAEIADPVGIASVAVINADWSLNENFAVEGATTYSLSYDLTIPAEAVIGDSYEILIIATNVNGITLEATQTLVLNQDITAPVITNSTAVGMAFLDDGTDATLEISVTDDMSIATFKILGPSLSEEISVGSSQYTYSRELNIVDEAIYEYEITVTDAAGNTSTQTVEIVAFEPFDNMYLADVDTDEALVSDLMGVPALTEGFAHVDSIGKVFKAHYYSAAANTEVRFLPSGETFSGLTLGTSTETGRLAAGTDATVAPIVLPEVGYYEIVIDLRNMSYTMGTYTPEDTPFDITMFIGRGVRVNGASTCVDNSDGSPRCFHFLSGKQLTKDTNNAYRFTGVVELYDEMDGDKANSFIIGANPAGWAPFWRFDASVPLEGITVPGGGSNYNTSESQYGTYNAVFDTHLNRFVMTPTNE